MENKRLNTTSFKIPDVLAMRMNQKLVSDGYGLRGKTRWICDAIVDFLSNDEDFCIECIQYTDEMEALSKSISFRPTPKVEELLDRWKIKTRKEIPNLEGVRSKIIRASIIQGLLASSFKNATL